jgi:hypothetical protein
MQILMIGTVGTLFVVWMITAVRLIILARRTRAVPELVLGMALLLQVALGYPLSVVAQLAGSYAIFVTLAAGVFTNAGMGLIFVFTAKVFHDASRWAWALVGAAGALLAVQVSGHVLSQATAATQAEKLEGLLLWGAGSLALCGFAWGWTAFEALRFHAQLRKRAALGLADPVVANRMLLWGLMGVIAVFAVVVDTGLLYGGGTVGREVLLPLVTALCGLAVSVCMILAFWPPAAYLAFLRGGSTAARA